jgi:DNA-binding NtrC family response regulator
MSEPQILHLHRGRHVLVVEDDYLLASDLEEALRRVGAMVVGPAASVTQALRLIEQDRRISAALLDVNLGGEMAFPVIDRLRAGGIPVLLTTGYGEADLPGAYQGLPRCEKPYDPAHCLDRLLTMQSAS